MEESAFEHHARQWRQKALTVSRGCGASEAEAEDIAQDVMLRLWQMRTEIERYRSIEAVVTVMAKRMTWSLRIGALRASPGRMEAASVDDRELLHLRKFLKRRKTRNGWKSV